MSGAELLAGFLVKKISIFYTFKVFQDLFTPHLSIPL